MVEFVFVWKRVFGDGEGGWLVCEDGLCDDGRRKVYFGESVESVREKVRFFIGKGWLVEFMGLGWRCVFDGRRYVWSRIRGLEEYGDDLWWG